MRKIREILRLRHECGLSHRAISASVGVGAATVSEYLAKAKGLGWPLPKELSDAELEKVLYPRVPSSSEREGPDFVAIHEELRRHRELTLLQLWVEYAEDNPRAYRYSRYCELYHRWKKKLNPTMRQRHRAGEKTFVDFSGKRPHIVDPKTGELQPVELFVGTLGASSYTYVEATADQSLESWVGAHERMGLYFGGSSEIWVPDNLKSGVQLPDRYEAGINRSYEELASHYGAVVIPARVAKPKDKAKVESAVQVAQRWILAVLRHHTFFSLAELNEAIREQLERLNARPMQKLGVSRRVLYERLDGPALKPLPVARHELARWAPCTVDNDYHVEVDGSHYSVPYQLIDETGDRLTPSHTKKKNGQRLRYYVSRRLIQHSGQKDLSGWRLPAPMLEQTVLHLIRQHVDATTFPASLTHTPTMQELASVHRFLDGLCSGSNNDSASAAPLLRLIRRVDISPGSVSILLDRSTFAACLSMGPERIREDVLRIHAPFRLRRRGVETKLVLGNPTKSVDRTLLRNIANALSWLDRIKTGKTYEEIATEDAIPTDRVRKAIRYAFLAPDIVRAIVEGRQPVGLTSSYLLHHPLPDDWEKQRVLVKTL